MLNILDDLGDFDAEIVDFDDQFSEKGGATELIFSIIVDRTNKNVTVVFRGTVNTKDILVDGNFWPTSHRLIEKVTTNGAKVHSGFCHYLCDHTNITGNDSQFDNIYRILKEVYAYKKDGHDYSKYKLVLSGHSLGGALAQLSTFLIAGLPDSDFIPSPVTGVTYASPVVGNRAFFDTMRKMEKANRVRHIRVSNSKDIIPGNPFWSYVQTGVNIHLKEDVPAEVKYENTKHCLSLLSMDPMGRHSIFEEGGYYERLYDKDKDGNYINIHFLGSTVEDLYKNYANLDEEDVAKSSCSLS
jgi:predicted lipase